MGRGGEGGEGGGTEGGKRRTQKCGHILSATRTRLVARAFERLLPTVSGVYRARKPESTAAPFVAALTSSHNSSAFSFRLRPATTASVWKRVDTGHGQAQPETQSDRIYEDEMHAPLPSSLSY